MILRSRVELIVGVESSKLEPMVFIDTNGDEWIELLKFCCSIKPLRIGAVIVVSSAVVTLVATDGSGPDPQLPLHSYGSLPSFSNSSLQQVPSPVNDPQRKRQSPSQQAPSPFGDPLPQNQFPSLQGHSLFGGPSPQGQFSSLQGLSPFSGQPRQGQFPAGSSSHGYPPFPKVYISEL
uniref:Uncharacterized protein n=1 Tax=Parascaris equorum TaxID=6256 RepID=A0A914RJ04_PAREQ